MERRQALPVSDGGCYEWQPVEGSKTKQRCFIGPKDGRWMWAAGLWSHWQHDDQPALDSATMIVRPARDDLAFIHDRSPMFIPDEAVNDWLNAPTPDDAMALLQAIELPELHARPVPGPIG
jgi:putative SOS response-associated peptidase YedK